MKPYRIIALTCCVLGAMSAPVYANVVTPESSLHGELLDALLTVSLLLIVAVFFLLRRIRSLTWAGVLALPAVFVVGAYWPETLTGNVWFYWSSSAVPNIDDYAWNIGFRGAVVSANFGEGNSGNARCVR